MVLKVIHTVASFSSFLPFVFGIAILNRSQKSIRFLTLLLGFACLTELTSRTLGAFNTSNLFLFHFYPAVEFICFVLIYYTYFEAVAVKRTLVGMGVLFVLFSVLNTWLFEPLNQYNANGRALESLMLVMISVYFLINRISSGEKPGTKALPMFWINTAVLLYYPINLVFFLMNNFLYENLSAELNRFLWQIHAFLSIAQYLLFTIAIYTEWKRTKSPVLS